MPLAQEVTGQRACVVAATVADRICVGMGLKQLILRVNEDLRRDEHIVGNEQELVYFQVTASRCARVHYCTLRRPGCCAHHRHPWPLPLTHTLSARPPCVQVLTTLLRYNRLKLNYEKSAHDDQASRTQMHEFSQGGDGFYASQLSQEGGMASAPAPAPVGWVPQLQNMIDALDKMTFARVLYTMDKLHKKDKRFTDEHIPIALYKEMICYVRVLLESANTDHNDIAVATLYRLFYISSERQDPLPRLLTEWKPGVYGRKHLNVLVELVHETLKTLDTARSKYGDPSADAKKMKRPRNKRELDIEQYTAAAVMFNVDEYFKRIVNNHSVRIYTRLLALYATNEPHVNHYAFCFLQRMCAYRLEQTIRAPAPPPRAAAGAPALSVADLSTPEDTSVTLGHLLFNLHTLVVFNDLLSDAHAAKQKALEPLLRLVKAVVRRFGDAAHKNHLLYAEALFKHNHAHDFCVQLDNVYEAAAYAGPGGVYGASRPALGGYDDSDGESDRARARPKMHRRPDDDEDDDDSDDVGAPRGARAAGTRDRAPRVAASDDEEEFDETTYPVADVGQGQRQAEGPAAPTTTARAPPPSGGAPCG